MPSQRDRLWSLAFVGAALAIAIVCISTPSAAQRTWDPPPLGGEDGVLREDVAPSAAVDAAGPGVMREELDPVMASDGSGLPHELWSGLPADQLAAHIAAIELPPRSPVLHALLRRLITSDVAVAADGTSPVRFTALRVEALDQTGLIDEAAAVLARDQASNRDPVLLALVSRSEIGLGNIERACEISHGLLSARAALPTPMQADALLITGYCAAQQGDKERAGIAAGLLKELDGPGLVGADLLNAIAAGLKPQIPADVKISAIEHRIAELGGGLDRGTLVSAAVPALLVALAYDPRIAPDVRLAAGEAAAARNALGVQDLAPLYRADGAGGDAGTIERAGLFKSAEAERTPLRKARHIRAFLDESRRAGLYWPALQLMAEPTAEVTPLPEIGWFAETAVEVNLAAGRFEEVRRWARFSGSQDSFNPSAPSPLAHWIALADIADPVMRGERGGHLGSVEAMAIDGRFDPGLLHRLATVLEALGINVPTPLWELASRSPQPKTGHLPDAGILSQLKDASNAKQFGRTVLLALRTIGPKGADGAHMIALGDSIRALKSAGLEAEARQLALEGLFSAWPRAVSQ